MKAFERFVMGLRKQGTTTGQPAVLGEFVGHVIAAVAETEGVESAVPWLCLATNMIVQLVVDRLVRPYLLLDQSLTARFLKVALSYYLRRA